MSAPPVVWKWFGYPGHFIAANSCQFRMCTQVGDHLISTIGDYRPYEDKPRRTIGAGHEDFFETYVFKVSGGVCNAKDCGCGMPELDLGEIDGERTATAGEAQAAHMRYCEKYAAIAVSP